MQSGPEPSVLDPSLLVRRRGFLTGAAGWLGGAAFAQMVRAEPVPNHHRPSADAVICLFQHGGPSQIDLFDPKPELNRLHGQPYRGELEVHFNNQKGNCLGSPYRFLRYGQCGMEMSELIPHTGSIADDLTLVRSVTTESVDHESALRLIHSGKFQAGYPSWGAWVLYGLGSLNQNLPAYVVLSDPGGMPVDGTRNWTSGWLPAQYQGTAFRPGKTPVPNLQTPETVTDAARTSQLGLLRRLNQAHLERHGGNQELAARLTQFETAARMQLAVPEALDISQESAATRRLYGLDQPATAEYGTRCLIARRLVERGVRFVQLFLSGQPWDTHSKNAETLKGLCARTDQPSAALVKDLKQRGMLDRTMVIWGGEFGRLPISQGADGRDHNRHANSLWIAGGGFKRGYVHGATDEVGYAAVQDKVSVHELHATLLHAMGLDHQRLTYPHEGRDLGLTDVAVTRAKVESRLLERP